jgi:anaerobic selenocysteine-containing dehydrogenase
LTVKRKVHTFCRICEPSCGLVAEVEGDRLLKLRPDVDHPVTRGFACHRGLGFGAIHEDPDRLDVPLARKGERGAGPFEARGWDEAIADIAQRLREIRERYGGNAIAGYFGNPSAFNTTAAPALSALLRQLGSRRLFNSGTQDCANKFAGAEAVFGTSTLHPVPDLEHTRYALIFGENPAVSHMSFVSIADPMNALRNARRRGATIRFVNPRRIESATPATGEVLQIKPDTDLYLMAALLHEIDAAGLFREDVIAAHGKRIEGLRAFIAPYSAQAVAEIVGLDAQIIRSVALEFACAESACAHMSTGVNMGRQGTLCYWLLQMLSFVTGNLDRRGGNLYAAGFYPAAKSGRVDPEAIAFRDTPFGPLREIRGALPGNLLADLIETDPASGEEPIRALIVMAGNPLLSMGGEARLRRAFAKLDLLVVLDLYRNATGEYADWLLPCADMLERADLNLCGLGMQSQPFVQYSEAVVPPRGERREEWWICARIAQALEPSSAAGAGDPLARFDRMLAYAGLSLARLRESPAGTVSLPPAQTGRFYDEHIQTPDRRVDCCPPLFADALTRAHAIFAELKNETPQQIKLINLRTPYMHNSWFQNVEKLKRPHQQRNPLHLSPDDAARLALQDGDAIVVRNEHGAIEASVHIDDTLRAGVAAMTHGWGQSRTPGMRVAQRYPGVNVNELLPSGPGSYDPLSNQAYMTGIPIEIARTAVRSE